MYSIGQRVRCKINDKDYRLFVGDMGTIVKVNERAGNNSFITVEWDQSGNLNRPVRRDLGWWIEPQAPLPGGKEISHVSSNLEIFNDIPDTREYLETVAGLAALL